MVMIIPCLVRLDLVDGGAYSVVVLPLPVDPVTSTIPLRLGNVGGGIFVSLFRQKQFTSRTSL